MVGVVALFYCRYFKFEDLFKQLKDWAKAGKEEVQTESPSAEADVEGPGNDPN